MFHAVAQLGRTISQHSARYYLPHSVSILAQVYELPHVYAWYGDCVAYVQRRRHNEEIDSYNTNEFAGGFPGDPERTCLCRRNPPGNHRQREELRRDQQQLEQLRQRRNREIREGDKREAREYNEKIRDQQREISRDRKSIYGDRDAMAS